MARPVTLFTGQWADLPFASDPKYVEVRELNAAGYRGPLAVEWEDSGMEREFGAREALQFVRKVDFPPSALAFDEAMKNH